MSPPQCRLGRHDWEPMRTFERDDPSGRLEGIMMVCRRCGTQNPEMGLLRKGAKLFNTKGYWVATVEKEAIK